MQQKFLPRRQSLVLVRPYFPVIVGETDQAEHQREKPHIEVYKDAPRQKWQSQSQYHNAASQNKHYAAHGGRTRFGGVPFGAVRPDFLPRFQSAQFLHHIFPDHQGQEKTDPRRKTGR